MAKLPASKRNKLSKSSFALPGKSAAKAGGHGKAKGAYPIPDASHARNALARVSQHGTSAQKATVRAAVKRKFPAIGKKKK